MTGSSPLTILLSNPWAYLFYFLPVQVFATFSFLIFQFLILSSCFLAPQKAWWFFWFRTPFKSAKSFLMHFFTLWIFSFLNCALSKDVLLSVIWLTTWQIMPLWMKSESCVHNSTFLNRIWTSAVSFCPSNMIQPWLEVLWFILGFLSVFLCSIGQVFHQKYRLVLAIFSRFSFCFYVCFSVWVFFLL